jgi:hypothetical protein
MARVATSLHGSESQLPHFVSSSWGIGLLVRASVGDWFGYSHCLEIAAIDPGGAVPRHADVSLMTMDRDWRSFPP